MQQVTLKLSSLQRIYLYLEVLWGSADSDEAQIGGLSSGVAFHDSRSAGVDQLPKFLIFFESEGYLKHIPCNAMTDVQESK